MSWSFMREKTFAAEVNIGAGMTGRIRAGCAGWNLPRAVQQQFPGQGTHLERYAGVLPAVEINSSFYRPHRPATYARWHDSVPEQFRFSVKMPRAITHQLRLHAADRELQKFIEEAGCLREKFGCVLVQLPPSLAFERAAAARFFQQLRSMADAGIACEPRHPSWASADASELLGRFRVARVIADPVVMPAQSEPHYADLVYMRLHGSPIIYRSSYSDQVLRQLADDIAMHKRLGREVWCVFDNTASGAAVPNALTLLDQLAAAEQPRMPHS
jgi:uncharacterized protein YecE (DUF72 family)